MNEDQSGASTSSPARRDRRVRIGERDLAVSLWGDDDGADAGAPSVVFLHDGLGSVGQWRDVPAAVANRTGRTVAAYDRAGHGASTPAPAGPWPADWLHTEAEVLGALLHELGADDAALVGHSDGGSIAAIHAAATPEGSTSPLILLAAHTWTEDVTVAEIRRMREQPEPIVGALARFHEHPAAVFEAWSGAWVSEAFATWDIRPLVGAITRPTLVAQGAADEYATPFHATSSGEAIGANAEVRLLPDLGHLLHHQAPDTVVDLVVEALG